MKLSDFEPVTIGEVNLFREIYSKHPPEHSDYMHSTMVSWSHYMSYGYAFLDDALVIMTDHLGKKRLRPPIGDFDPKRFSEVMGLAKKEGMEHVISMIGDDTLSYMKSEFPDLKYVSHRDYFDYVYLADDLADLPGKKYLKVRNYLNRFRRENRYVVEFIDEGNIDDTREFLRRWCKQKGCGEDPFLLSEREATSYSLDHLSELGLEGNVVRIDGNIEALAIYEKMRDNMAVVHFEKANADILGLYQAINNETAMILRGRYKYINRESDMGVKGLRRAKQRYRPHHMLEVHHAEI